MTQSPIRESDIKEGLLICGISDKYTYTNYNMTKGIITKVEGDRRVFIQMLEHKTINKMDTKFPIRNYELMKNFAKLEVKEENEI